MKKLILCIVLIMSSLVFQGQIIADHTVVDRYDDIPQRWIDSVKTKLVWIAGMSHGYGYFRGAELLEQFDPRFQVDIWLNTSPPAKKSTALRLGRIGLTRESIWTNQVGIDNLLQNIITPQNNSGNPYHFFWFGWSYQGTWENGLGGGIDPVHNVHWAGSTQGGPDGNLRWGLDADDKILTGNSVSMDTYLNAMEQYISYCSTRGYVTRMVYSNGVSDLNSGTELGYQRELKNKHIRDYVARDNTACFIDYSDILVHSNSGELFLSDWNDGGTIRRHQQIHPENLKDYDSSFNIINPETDAVEDHIGEVGALRLAKAMWWLLARLSGWDGITTGIEENNRGKEFMPAIVEHSGDQLLIQIPRGNSFSRMLIYNLKGVVVIHKVIDSNSFAINVSGLPSGIYLLSFSTGTINRTMKILINN